MSGRGWTQQDIFCEPLITEAIDTLFDGYIYVVKSGFRSGINTKKQGEYLIFKPYLKEFVEHVTGTGGTFEPYLTITLDTLQRLITDGLRPCLRLTDTGEVELLIEHWTKQARSAAAAACTLPVVGVGSRGSLNEGQQGKILKRLRGALDPAAWHFWQDVSTRTREGLIAKGFIESREMPCGCHFEIRLKQE